MHTTFVVPGNSRTILMHLFGRGLEDDRYVVERFDALADGEIRPRPARAPAKKGRGKAKRTIASLRAVRRLRPARRLPWRYGPDRLAQAGFVLRIKSGVAMDARYRAPWWQCRTTLGAMSRRG